MSFLAGVFDRRSDKTDEKLRSMVLNAAALANDSPPSEFTALQAKGFFCTTKSIPTSEAWIDQSDTRLLIGLGHPYFPGANTQQEDIRSFSDCIVSDSHASLAASNLQHVRGNFAAVIFLPLDDTVVLIADKLSIRPLYYAVSDRYIFFSTQLSIFRYLPLIPQEPDIRALVQLASGLGFICGRRTPWASVKALYAAEIITIRPYDMRQYTYYQWGSASPSPSDNFPNRLYDEFSTAVSLRFNRTNDSSNRATAFLSGGLDSRVVVASLTQHAEGIDTVNFAFPNTLDKLLAARLAESLQINHYHHSATLETRAKWDPAFQLSRLRERSDLNNIPAFFRPVWSGDGGSVGLGHVYMNHEVVYLLRSGSIQSAINRYLTSIGARLAERVLTPQFREVVIDILTQEIEAELAGLSHISDPARRFHVFLLLNDQRRHLWDHYENILQHEVELILPFFDSDFLGAVVAHPIDGMLLHQFYNEWLRFFPEPIYRVPWQAYPGHASSNIEPPDNAIDQWDPDSPQYKVRRRMLSQLGKKVLLSPLFPHSVVRRSRLAVLYLLHQCGIRDYGYVFEQVEVFDTYLDY